MNANRAAFRTNSQVPKIGRPSWEPGISRQEVTYSAATISAPLLRRQLSGGTPRAFCRSTAESLGREATFFPHQDNSLGREQHHDSRSGAESAYLPGRTQTVAILTTQGLMSSRPPQFLLRNPTDLSYSALLSLASQTTARGRIFSQPLPVRHSGSVKGDSPIFADTKIGTVPANMPKPPATTANSAINDTVFHHSRLGPFR